MLTSSSMRRALAPALITGFVAAVTALTGAAPASAAPTAIEVPTTYVVPGTMFKLKPPPWVLPVAGYHLTGRFGQTSGLWSRVHTGLDFAAPEGVVIRSIAPGVVTEASTDAAFGNKTVVRLDDGTVLWYCHQSRFGAKVGQRLAAGDLVGYIGSTGNTTGPHLHLEVHPGGGSAVDPEVWLSQHGLHP